MYVVKRKTSRILRVFSYIFRFIGFFDKWNGIDFVFIKDVDGVLIGNFSVITDVFFFNIEIFGI